VGLNEDLCRLSGLTDEQVAGLDDLEAMTAKQRKAFAKKVDQAWDSNVDTFQEIKEALAEAARGYKEACDGYIRLTAPFRSRISSRQLTPTEADIEHEAALAMQEAYEVKVTAGEAVEEAKVRFKQGVTADQLGAG
jgi:ElaB/YqjD/DUF883 family membrane-anchored ribosome-binding protein